MIPSLKLASEEKEKAGDVINFFNFLVMFLFIIFLFISSGIDLGCNDSFFTTSGEHSAQNLLAISNGVSDFFSKITIGNFEVLTHVTTVVHQGEIIVVNVAKLVVLSGHIGHVHVVGGGANIFAFLSCENVEGDHVDFGVTVLTGLGGGHLHNLARAALNHNKSVFTQSRTLHRVGGRSSSISRLEIKFISHLFRFLFKQKLETKKEMRSRLFSWFGRRISTGLQIKVQNFVVQNWLCKENVPKSRSPCHRESKGPH